MMREWESESDGMRRKEMIENEAEMNWHVHRCDPNTKLLMRR